jgi:hypothetical protein
MQGGDAGLKLSFALHSEAISNAYRVFRKPKQLCGHVTSSKKSRASVRRPHQATFSM